MLGFTSSANLALLPLALQKSLLFLKLLTVFADHEPAEMAALSLTKYLLLCDTLRTICLFSICRLDPFAELKYLVLNKVERYFLFAASKREESVLQLVRQMIFIGVPVRQNS